MHGILARLTPRIVAVVVSAVRVRQAIFKMQPTEHILFTLSHKSAFNRVILGSRIWGQTRFSAPG